MEHLDHPSPHVNDAKMARFLLLRAFIIALGGMGDNCSILYCDKLNVWRTRKKSEPQMGFEPTTLRDLVGCSNH